MNGSSYTKLDQSVDAALDQSVDAATDNLDSGVAGGDGINYDISRVTIGKPCKTNRICDQEKGERCYKREGNQFKEITEIVKNRAGFFVPTGEEGNCLNPSQAYGEIPFGNTLEIGDLIAAKIPRRTQGCLGKEGRVGRIDRISKPSRRESEQGNGELIYDVTCLNKSVFRRDRERRGYWWNEIRAATPEEIKSLDTETGEFDLRPGDPVIAVNPETIQGCLGKQGRVGRILFAFGILNGELYYGVRCLNMWCFQNQYYNYRYNEIRKITEEEVEAAIDSNTGSPFRCFYGGGSIKIHKRKRNKKTKRKRKKTKRRKRTVKKSKRRNR